MKRRDPRKPHPMNCWDEIAKARASRRNDDFAWAAVWLGMIALLASVFVISVVESGHDRHQSSVRVPVYESR